ncbi:hypothetical protein Ciccas_005480 [Cichlidogyrus casuarinus]|uniref:Uncharacterized protein n=1 Tax=Cichlidogyrus casuarinus TaxID=1844966 RepID=A0ABD2Q9I5_9PLAT
MLSGTPITRRAHFRRSLSAASAAFSSSPYINDSWLGLKCRTTSGDLRSALIATATPSSGMPIGVSGVDIRKATKYSL